MRSQLLFGLTGDGTKSRTIELKHAPVSKRETIIQAASC